MENQKGIKDGSHPILTSIWMDTHPPPNPLTSQSHEGGR
jgi:hypothetical protein